MPTMEQPVYSPSPESTKTPERAKSETELEIEELERLEQEALTQWADIMDIVKQNDIDLENLLDPREEDPKYKYIKERLLNLKDETLKILFELDNKKEVYRRKGLIVEA